MNESDQQAPGPAHASGLDLRRGLGFAVLSGAIGFVVLIVVIGSVTLARWFILGSDEVDKAFDLHWFPVRVANSVVALMFVFASTGWATHAPKGTFRFLQTLSIVAFISIPTWILLGSLGMAHPRYKSFEHPVLYPSEVLLFAIPPIMVAMVLTVLRAKERSA